MSAPVPHRSLLVLLFLGASAAIPAQALRPAPAGSTSHDRSEAPSFVLTGEDLGAMPAAHVLPLKASHTTITVSGVVAEVVVQQTWQNTTDAPLEATYVFPASTRAAVHDLTMTLGDRVIRADIQDKQQARQTYQAARDAGQTASLLEQKRPNVFQIAVANILPGDEIVTVLTYVEPVVPTGGVYEVVAPQVVGPRYGHTAEKGDEAWRYVPNPYLNKGSAPFAWSVDVDVRTPLPLASIGSPSHPFTPRYQGPGRVTAHFATADGAAGPDRDLVIRYRLQGDAIQTGAMLYRTPRGEENFFLLMMEPPAQLESDAIPPREVVFIVDVSGSMRGFPTEITRRLMADLLKGLRPQDRFNILLFSAGSSLFSEQSVAPTADNVAAALAFQEGNATYGGTELARALKRALLLPTTSEAVSRSFVVLTDGYIHAERDTFRLVREHVGDANLFAFGVGQSVNRYLIEGLARAGRSEPFFALNQPEATRETERFVALVSRPALTDIKVTFEGLRVHDVVPAEVPDLMAERPLVVFGKYRGPTRGRAIVTGRTGQGRFRQVIKIEDNTESKTNRALRTLWARARLSDVADFTDDPNKRKKEITRLGLTYRLATPFTSFVAVDKRKRTKQKGRRVQQPAAHPAGMASPSTSSTGEQTFQQRTVIDFSDVNVEGELTRPQGSYLMNRKRGKVNKRGALLPKGPQKRYRRYGMSGSGVAKGKVSVGHGRVAGTLNKPAPSRNKIDTPRQPLDLNRASSAGSDMRRTVYRQLERRMHKVKACHAERQYSRPGVHGDVTFKVVFGPAGRVVRIDVTRNSLYDEQLTRCMEDRIRRWRVPRRAVSGRALSVVFSLHFDPLPAAPTPAEAP
jgi:Ca-activated chloride channel family protein